ncbi:MAG: leucyl aminopeptidase [Rickettsiaceae bacterium]
MKVNVTIAKNTSDQDKNFVIFIKQDLTIGLFSKELDAKFDSLISNTIQNNKDSIGKFGNINTINHYDSTQKRFYNILIIGTGEKSLESFQIEELGGKIFKTAKSHKLHKISILCENYFNEECASIVSGLYLASYRFHKYLTKKPEDYVDFDLNSIELITNNNESELEKLIEEKHNIAYGVFTARDYVSEPPNILYPESYADSIVEKLDPLGVDVEILDERKMAELGMGAILGVGQGSEKESRLVIMKYNGADDSVLPIALAGKGVTFDTGGISIKPSMNMHDMKYDMGGSATVVGTIEALARCKAKTNVVGIVGLVENMPSGTAQRPGDIVKTMSGQTAEVLNTDAEGRLVLADVVWYVQEKYQPQLVIDVATLTGAVLIALGNTFAGCFANDDELADNLISAGKEVNERLWRLPLDKEYDQMLRSDVADVANITTPGGYAGSSTAAHFIGRFIKKDMKWAHLDIAGMAWTKKGTDICPKGAVGYGVRLLSQFIKNHYESK